MYEYNNGQNNAQFQGSYTTEPQPPKKPKKPHKTAKVVALVALVTVLCGGVGFGGAFVANQFNRASQLLIQDDSGTTSGENSGDESTPDSAPESDPADSSDSGDNSDNSGILGALESSSTASRLDSSTAARNSDGSYAYTRDLVAAVKDSIVYIEQYVKYYGQETAAAAGSGIIVSQDGYIITNAHVVENDTYEVTKVEVYVNTTDPSNGSVVTNTYEAQLLGSDTDTDLAVLKIDAENLSPAKLGDSDKLATGDDIVVIGNPLGLESSVTKGIVSGLNRQVYDDNAVSAIQTDAPINSGNSGGGMFNMFGEVVGVVNMKLINDNAENLGFAITINDAKPVISDLVTKGYVTGRPILGITYMQVSEYLGAVQNMTPGMLVTDISRDMAIAKSDLKVGDTIIAIDDINVFSVEVVSDIFKDKKPGDTVTLTVVRADYRGRDKKINIEVELSEYTGN